MIIVTGATGMLGRGVVLQLLERVSANQLGVSVRDPAKAADLEERGVRVRHGDFDDPASLEHAFEGATQVLIVSSNSGGERTVQQHRAAIEAAREAGARRILYTSQMGARAVSHFAPMQSHAATEALLQASGVPFTSLRNGYYGSTALWLMGDAPRSGELAAPADGPVAWTTHADLAEATAVILQDEGRLDGISPPLTAGEALDLSALSALAAEVTGRPIQRVTLGDDEFRAGLLARSVPAAQIDIILGIYRASRAGDFSAVDPTLGTLLGRAPVSMRELMTGALA